MLRVTQVLGFTILAVGIGCSKKPAPEPEVKVENLPAPPEKAEPSPTPKPKPAPKPGPRPKPGPSGKEPEVIFGAYNRFDTKSQLIEICFALYRYEEANKQYPAGIVGPNGDLGLSWRVALLPYMDDKSVALFKEFKLAEPWDSPHNKALLTKMPKEFATPGTAVAKGRTYFRAFAGPQAFIPLPERAPKDMSLHWGAKPGQFARGRTRAAITDGEHNTLMVVMANEPVEWTKPEYLTYTDDSFPKLGVHGGEFLGLRCGGSVDVYPETLTANTLRAIVSVNAGDRPGPELHVFGFAPPAKK